MSDTWNKQIETIQSRYESKLGDYYEYFRANPLLRLIADKIIQSCASSELNEAYSGGHGDGGASKSMAQFAGFLDGYSFANGQGAGIYQHIIDQAELEKDADYRKYVELKELFEKK
jgi:hypothetical protein